MVEEVRHVEAEVVEEAEAPQTQTGGALARRPPTDLTPIDMGLFRAWAESREQALTMLMDIGLATTKPEHWRNMGGKAYPEQGACSAIINQVGIEISPPARRKEAFTDEKGSYYMYVLEAECSIPRFGIGPEPIVGRASSRDPFFAERRDDTGSKVLRPQSEVDPGDILAKAYTNLRYRAVKALVPQVANITWEALEALTKGRVSQRTVGQVAYAGGEETPAGQGNCPTCRKGTLIEKSGTKDGKAWRMWVCDQGRWDRDTKKTIGCPHRQFDPPAAPKPAPESETEAPPEEAPANGKAALVNRLMAAAAAKGMKTLPATLVKWASDIFQRDVAGPMDLSEAEAEQLLKELQTPEEEAGQETLA